MKKENPKKKKNELPKDFLLNVMPGAKISVFFQTIAYTVATIAIFGLIGYYLDKKFDTAPIILIIAVAVSYPFTQILLLRRFKKFSKNKMEQAHLAQTQKRKNTKAKNSKSKKK